MCLGVMVEYVEDDASAANGVGAANDAGAANAPGFVFSIYLSLLSAARSAQGEQAPNYYNLAPSPPT